MSMKVIASIEERCKTYGLYDCIYEAFFTVQKKNVCHALKALQAKLLITIY